MVQSRNKRLGLSSLLAASLLLLGIAFLWDLPRAAAWVLVWAGVESLLAFYGVSWGLERSNQIFLSIFFGGMLLRLVSIGVVAALLTLWSIPPVIPLVSLVAGYFILSMVQIPFLDTGLRRGDGVL